MNHPRHGPRPRAIHREPPHRALQAQVATCSSCANLTRFNIRPTLSCCAVLQIHLTRRDTELFGCALHEARVLTERGGLK